MPRLYTLIALLAALPNIVLAESTNDQASDEGVTLAKFPAVLFLMLYGVTTLLHWINYFRNKHRPRAYMLNLTIGMFCMSIGFIMRAANNYAWQFLFTFLSPCAFFALDYTILKHLARAVGPAVASSALFLPARAIVVVFLLSDLVTFCAQTVGTVFVIIGGDWLSLGEKLAIGGLVLQILSFSLFAIALVVFARRLSRDHPTVWASPTSGGNFWHC
ncbi:hypothetical protein JCM8547_005226 [Rhodosporidiobolus lusitaniae]